MKPQNYKIVYATSMIEPTNLKRTRFASRKCAQNAADRINERRRKNGFRDSDKLVVYSLDEYSAATEGKGEWKNNALSGKPVWVPLGTPSCCDPTTETYWSM